MPQPSDIAIARAARKLPIQEIGARLGIPAEALIPFGHDKAKVAADFLAGLAGRPTGRLVLVTAINPTPAGEGKTTTTVGLGDGLNAIGRKAMICLREPSLGPCFGMKGGAAGGGHAQIVPMEDINLHFTGDFHAITAAHNLLAALVDNHVYWGNELDIDPRRVTWRRVMDMNDRALRQVVTSLGGVRNGYPREGGFDITVASEVMAILCLADDLADLERRLGDVIIGYTRDRRPVHARDLKADGAMAVLLAQAILPNLVQTLENNPAFVHGGPFANIAHGCNSVVATRTALRLADFVVTEAGFGADLGAEKFLDIKCRKAGLHPDAAVIVATVRALKMNGGVGAGRFGPGERRGGAQGLCQPRAAHRQHPLLRGAGRGCDQPLRRRQRGGGGGGQGLRGGARHRGDPLPALGRGLEGDHRAGDAGGEDRRLRGGAVRRALSRRHAALPQDRDHRPADLRRRRGAGRHADPRRSCTTGRRRATATCRSAWPRRSTPSRPTRTCAARRPASGCRCARCASPPAPASSW